MFGSIGGPELIVIFIVALLIFGPRKLPELGRMLGKGMAEFRRAANDLKDSLETEVAREQPARVERKAIPAPAAVPTSADGGQADGPAPAGVEAASSGSPTAPSTAAQPLPDAEEPVGHP